LTQSLVWSAVRPRIPGWLTQQLREPLLHFVLLGGVLFGVDHFVAARAEDPHTIVIDAATDRDAITTFKNSRGRDPDARELSALRRVWLDNEILYREGLALRVDAGDAAIRERVIFKALSLLDANVKLPPITEATLRTWFEAHHDKYDEPARYDFEEAVLAGDNSEESVRTFVQELTAGTPGDAKAGLRRFKGRPLANLEQSYGPDFPETLAALPVGEWHALHTRDGWRAMRLEAITAPKPAEFTDVSNAVRQDWVDAMAAEQRTAAVRALEGKYRILYPAVSR
jgi:hypothetical protein